MIVGLGSSDLLIALNFRDLAICLRRCSEDGANGIFHSGK